MGVPIPIDILSFFRETFQKLGSTDYVDASVRIDIQEVAISRDNVRGTSGNSTGKNNVVVWVSFNHCGSLDRMDECRQCRVLQEHRLHR